METMKRYAFFAALLLLLMVPKAHAQLGAGLKAMYGLDAEEVLLGGELHIPVSPLAGLTFAAVTLTG